MNFEKYIVALFALLIPLSYLGRSLFSIDLFLILIFFIVLSINNKTRVIPFKKLRFLLIILLFYILVLFINFLNPTLDYKPNIKMLGYLTIILYILTYVFNISNYSKNNFLLFQKLFFYFVAFTSFVVFISFISDINIIYTIKNFEIIKFDHSVFHSRQNLFAVCIPFYLSYYLNNQNKINLSLLSFIYLGTFAAQGRTAILTIFVGTLAYFIYEMYEKKEFTQKKIYLLITVSLVSLFLILIISGSNLEKLEVNTSGRFDGWRIYLQLILEKNTLFGYGLQGGQHVYESGFLNFKHPHNIFVESLFYLGVSGLILIISMFAFYAYIIWGKDAKINDKRLMLSFFISLLVMQQAIGSLWGSNNTVPLIIMIYLSLNAITHLHVRDR